MGKRIKPYIIIWCSAILIAAILCLFLHGPKAQVQVVPENLTHMYQEAPPEEEASVHSADTDSGAEPEFHEPDFDVRVTGAVGLINFRSGPGTDYSIITEIYNGEYLHISDLSFNWQDRFLWGKVVYDNLEGWVSLRQTSMLYGEGFASPDFYVVTVGDEPINLRSGPGLTEPEVSDIPIGKQLHITDLNYNVQDGIFWGQTSYEGQKGWVAMARVEVDHSGVVQKDWRVVYQKFFRDQEYLTLGSTADYLFPDTEIFLADLDRDLVPEIFAYCGTGEIQGDQWDVFAFQDNEARFLGTVKGFPYGQDPEKAYPGVFFEEGDYVSGKSKYITLAEKELSEEILIQRTVEDDTGAWNTEVLSENGDLRSALRRAKEALNIVYSDNSGIDSMGFDAFLNLFGFTPEQDDAG